VDPAGAGVGDTGPGLCSLPCNAQAVAWLPTHATEGDDRQYQERRAEDGRTRRCRKP
jgi:hypothetical protein